MHARPLRERLIRGRSLPGILHAAAILALASGLSCLVLYTLAEADQRIVSARAVDAFHQVRDDVPAVAPDQSLWSASRRAAYREARLTDAGAPAALLRISSIDLLAPIFNGTSDIVLNRGIGWIEGTSAPGGSGNVGLAGHRDGFFRGLEDLRVGDSLEIQTIDASLEYRVTRISIVEPTDVHVLDATEGPSVTLVTCYPFFFAGSAPQRFIVRGVLDEQSARVRKTGTETVSAGSSGNNNRR